ncbi:Alkylated DNA repair protein AlkB [Minicystis rosea]|nr:Alkylated DNA repair protein AlkB [Minicystis rosea]
MLPTFTPPALDRLPIEDGLLLFHERWLPPDVAAAAFASLKQETPWKAEEIRIAGRMIPVPRRTAWYGDPEAVYVYSGLRNEPLPWTPLLVELRDDVMKAAGAPLNSVLLNLYRDGRDSMGWHADDEPELGENPVVASLSLGAPRRFVLRHAKKKGKSMTFVLGDGALLVMAGSTQRHYRHAVPKEEQAGERINLTFRRVIAAPKER